MKSRKGTRQQLTLFSLLIFLTFLGCSDKVIGPQEVNITPLINFKFSKNIQSLGTIEGYKKIAENGIHLETNARDANGLIEAFEKEFRRDYPNHEYSVIYVSLQLYRNFEKASEDFETTASYLQLKKHGSSFDRYLVSKIIQSRTDPEGGYRLMKSFRSKLVFQKNNLVISIEEAKSNLEQDPNWKDEIIRELVLKLNKTLK